MVWRGNTLICMIVLMFVSTSSKAVNVTYNLGFSLARYENINLVPNPTMEEWLGTTRARMILSENSPSLVANINADIAALFYKNQTQQNVVVANINATGRWIIKPKQFEWYLSNALTQTPINALQSNSQLNQQDTNSFLTGPNYFLRMNSLNNLNFEARAGNVIFANGIGDNDRTSSAIRWLYQLSRATTISANLESMNLNFKDALTTDYVRQNLYAKIDYIRGKNTFKAEAGITKIDYVSQTDQQGERYLLSVQNQRTKNSNVRFVYSHRITDTGTALLSSPFNQTSSTTNQSTSLTAASDVYTDDLLLFSYAKILNTGSFLITLNRSKQDYRTQNVFDVETTSISLSPTYKFSQISYVSLDIRQAESKYINVVPQRTDTDRRIMLSYNYSLGRRVSMNLAATHLRRSSNDVTRTYKDNNIMFTLTYTAR